jgi:hypothetical protein
LVYILAAVLVLSSCIVLARSDSRVERRMRVWWMRLWLPASICTTLEGFEAVDESPIRSPLLVADHLIEYAVGGFTIV